MLLMVCILMGSFTFCSFNEPFTFCSFNEPFTCCSFNEPFTCCSFNEPFPSRPPTKSLAFTLFTAILPITPLSHTHGSLATYSAAPSSTSSRSNAAASGRSATSHVARRSARWSSAGFSAASAASHSRSNVASVSSRGKESDVRAARRRSRSKLSEGADWEEDSPSVSISRQWSRARGNEESRVRSEVKASRSSRRQETRFLRTSSESERSWEARRRGDEWRSV